MAEVKSATWGMTKTLKKLSINLLIPCIDLKLAVTVK